MIPIELQTVLLFEGREYIVLSIQTTINTDGRSLEFRAYEPLVAMNFTLKAEQQREALLAASKASRLIDKELSEET